MFTWTVQGGKGAPSGRCSACRSKPKDLQLEANLECWEREREMIKGCSLIPCVRHWSSNPCVSTSRKITAIALISHASKVMLKILQARLQQYVNRELPDVQAGFRKGRGTRDQIASICWIMEKARELQKNILFCFFDYAKAFWLCGSQ